MKPVLVLEGIYKSFGREAVLRDISIEIGQGEVVGLLGPNGSGKTTTLRIAAGLFSPDQGKVEVNGRAPAASADNRKTVGYLPEGSFVYKALTVRSQLAFVARAHGLVGKQARSAIEAVLESCRLTEVATVRNNHLSKGFRQRLGMAQALLGVPSLLILDEATAGLDPIQVLEARTIIVSGAEGRATLISTHILEDAARLCDRVLIIRSGQIVARHSLKRSRDLGMSRVGLTVSGISNDEGLFLFGSVKGVRTVSSVPSQNSGERIFCCLIDEGSDPRADLARLAIRKGSLLEFRELDRSLEHMFFDSMRDRPAS